MPRMRLQRRLAGSPSAVRWIVGLLVMVPLLVAVGAPGWWKVLTIPLLLVGTEVLVFVGVLDSRGFVHSGWLQRRSKRRGR